ncbi:heme-binding protein [Mycolicibacterium komossense]|uniref:Heme-binding protein n=1 Tax=Mycolicibacterium komossense TaxID=1779 RepID=A0ABT3CB85_9MYCO|nr:heme-binding protein [Mycolicibacterium komossense]MCV7226701.1 heme-binding protein [Mycolicibacterium komossense]
MLQSIRSSRRAVVGVIGAGAMAGALLVGIAPTALADPPPPAPGCSAGDFEQVTAQVAAATSVYMFTHPDVNAFFSSLKGVPKAQAKSQIDAYYASNPQAQADLRGIRQPLKDMKANCQ